MNIMQRAVLKGGSSVFENANHIGTNQAHVDMVMGYHDELRLEEEVYTVQVASGAVVEGRAYCDKRGIDFRHFTAAELARLGTAGQIVCWQQAGDRYGIAVTQILATHQEIDNQAEGKAIIDAIKSDSEIGFLPVINEDEAAGKQEIKEFEKDEAERQAAGRSAGADNDWLAVHTAIALRADYIFLLSSDVKGFERDGKVLETISITQIEDLLRKYDDGGNLVGRGGIKSKLRAMKTGALALPNSQIIFGNSHTSPRDMLLGRRVCTRVVQ